MLVKSLDDHMGPRWEEAFRSHLRRLAVEGELGPEVVAIGSWWRDGADEVTDDLRLAICARESVTGASPTTLTVTAHDIFGR